MVHWTLLLPFTCRHAVGPWPPNLISGSPSFYILLARMGHLISRTHFSKEIKYSRMLTLWCNFWISFFNLGHRNFNRATLSWTSLARMCHQLSKLNDIPAHVLLNFISANLLSKNISKMKKYLCKPTIWLMTISHLCAPQKHISFRICF